MHYYEFKEDESSRMSTELLLGTNTGGGGGGGGAGGGTTSSNNSSVIVADLDVLYCEPISVIRHSVVKLLEKRMYSGLGYRWRRIN